MSRAYRIKVKESITREISASDEICSDLEILEILPKEQMADLLRGELEQRGYKEDNGKMIREKKGVTVTVDPGSGEVSVKANTEEKVDLETEKEGWGYDDVGPRESAIRKQLQEQAQKDLEKRAEQKKAQLQAEATKQLEGEMAEVRGELGQAINSITREALKRKAASLGQIKEMTEDPEAGSLTIKVEV